MSAKHVVNLGDSSTWKIKDHMPGAKPAAPAAPSEALSSGPTGKIVWSKPKSGLVASTNPKNPNFAPRKAWPESKLKVTMPKGLDPTRNRFEQMAEKKAAEEIAKREAMLASRRGGQGRGRGRGGAAGGRGAGAGNGGGGVFARIGGGNGGGAAAGGGGGASAEKKRKPISFAAAVKGGGGAAPLEAKLSMSLDDLAKAGGGGKKARRGS